MATPSSVEAYLAALPDSSRAAREELEPCRAGTGTIRFRVGEPLPTALVEKIVKARIEENSGPGRR